MEGGRRAVALCHRRAARTRVDHVFWLTPGHASEPGTWYAGTSPQGLFRSEDGGVIWHPVSGFNDHPEQHLWVGSDKAETPDRGTFEPTARELDPAHIAGDIVAASCSGAPDVPIHCGLAAAKPP